MNDPQPTAALTRSDGLRVTAFRIGKMIPLPFVGQPTEALLTRAPTGCLLNRKKRRAPLPRRPTSLLSFTLCPCRGGLFAEQALSVSPVKNIIMTAELVKDRLNAVPFCRVDIKFECMSPYVQ